MSKVSRLWSVGGKTPLNPQHIAKESALYGWPMAWHGLTNGISCPRGFDWGLGHFLLSHDDLEAINLDSAITVQCEHEGGTSTFQGYYAIRTQAVTKHETKPAQWLVLADRRYVMNHSAVNLRFNHKECDDEYVEDTTNGGTPYTWQEVLNLVWAELPSVAGSVPTLPSTPSSTPENLTFEGMSAWRAANQVLTAAGAIAILDPFAGTFSAQAGTASQSGFENLKTAYEPYIIWQSDPESCPTNNYPAEVETTFHRRPFPKAPETEAVASGKSSITGTKYAITDTMFATDTNGADRATRADEIKDSVIGLLKPAAEPFEKIYAGFREFKPGSQLTEVRWQSDGYRGMLTIPSFKGVPEIDWPEHSVHSLEALWKKRIQFTIVTADLINSTALVTVTHRPCGADEVCEEDTQQVTVYDDMGFFDDEVAADLVGRKGTAWYGYRVSEEPDAECRWFIDGLQCESEESE